MPKQININDKFGNWTVTDIAPSIISPCGTSRKAYKCKCDCGSVKIVAATQLRNGKSKSCGCKGSFLRPGEQYQEWIVIKKSEETNKHGSQFYLCKCSCGITRNVRMADLLNGSSKNCGHSRLGLSQGAKMIQQYLLDNGYLFYQEYIFSDLPKLRYDFALYDIDNPNKIIRLIEFDGEQHFENSHSNWHTPDLV